MQLRLVLVAAAVLSSAPLAALVPQHPGAAPRKRTAAKQEPVEKSARDLEQGREPLARDGGLLSPHGEAAGGRAPRRRPEGDAGGDVEELQLRRFNAGPFTAPFRALDNIEGDNVDLLFMPVDPMVLAPDRTVLWAVNAHNSQVVGFDDLSGQPAFVHDVPWGPVSLGYWVSSVDAHEELLVVSRGTYGLTRLDPASGTLLGYLALPAEPAGILVQGDHVFVACSALDQVVEVDLIAGSVFDTFEIDTTRHPLFLSSDGAGNVLVTPMLSGNNTMPQRSGVAGGGQSDPFGTVLNMADPAVAEIGLPDEDVFRLIPGNVPGSGSVEVVATGVGTNLFAHGVNPSTGQLWVLNTDAMNQDEELDSEPEIRGIFVTNRVTMLELPAIGGDPVAPEAQSTASLDIGTDAIGKPYGLDFASTGEAIVVGALTDNVTILSTAGAEIFTWREPDGSIPRQVIFDEVLSLFYVYNWGTNTIDVRNLLLPGVPSVVELDLGYDPTSDERKRGRAIFYDGDNSLNGNLSCESCHVEVLNDFLSWNLSDHPVDDKGVMFTQNLRGIEMLRPYHWRGERELLDFNPAFDGLLGGQELSDEDFADFEAFVFGVQNPANPFEDPRRVVTDNVKTTKFEFETHDGLSAVNGQDVYFDVPTVGLQTCQGCHTLPTGTVNDMFLDGVFDTGHRNTFVVPGYNGLWRKEMKTRVAVQQVGGGQELRPPLGSGLTHAGLVNGLFEFVADIPFAVSRAEREDMAHFMHQVDQGLAPAVHRAVLVAPGRLHRQELQGYLMVQARKRNCDVAVFGTVDLGQGRRELRWYWERATHTFVPEDPSVGPRDLEFFFDQALAGTGRNHFVGLPVGMGRRWGVDKDGDLLNDFVELALGTDARDPDTDGDGFLDGTEVEYDGDPGDAGVQPSKTVSPQIVAVREVFHTARVAKYIVETDVPTRLFVDYSSNLGNNGSLTLDEPRTLHSVHLRDLEPSNVFAGIDRVYTGTIRATDEFGHTAEVALPAVQTEPFVFAAQEIVPLETVVRDLTLVSHTSDAGGHHFTFDARVENRRLDAPAPLVDHVVVGKVIVNGEIEANLTVNGNPPTPAIFTQLGVNLLYGGFGGFGPFVVGSLSAGDGVSTLQFTLPDAQVGDVVQLSIEVVGLAFDPPEFDPAQPFFSLLSLFDFPNTPTEHRASEKITL